MQKLNSLPRNDDFHLVPDWYRHTKAYMMWPERADNWRNGAKPAQAVFAEIASKLSQYEPVTMLVSQKQYQNARASLPPSVKVLEMSFDDVWIRDTGPAYLMNQQAKIRLVDWQFNAWGGLVDGLYFPWDQDLLITKKLADLDDFDYYQANLVLEDCGYQTDGEGTLLAVEASVLSEGRNGQIRKNKVETYLQCYFNVTKIIWLKYGYYMDETNGDVDNLAVFIKPGVVALSWTEDKTDPMFAVCHDAYHILSQAFDAQGRQLKIHKVLLPRPLYATQEESNGVDAVNGLLPRYPSDRLTASYVNAYVANSAVFLPIFHDEQDDAAIALYTKLYPDHAIEPIYARELLLGGGNLHSLILGVPS